MLLNLSVSTASNGINCHTSWKDSKERQGNVTPRLKSPSKVDDLQTIPKSHLLLKIPVSTDLEKSNVSVPNNEDGQLRKNQVCYQHLQTIISLTQSVQSDTIRQRFIEVIRRYHNVESEYRTKFRQRVERQIRIGKKNMGISAPPHLLITP